MDTLKLPPAHTHTHTHTYICSRYILVQLTVEVIALCEGGGCNIDSDVIICLFFVRKPQCLVS